jgi:hypothetical protein
MRTVIVHAPRRAAIIAGTLIALTVLLVSPLVPAALAAVGACGSDPIVILSNGTELEFSTTIGAAGTDVQQVLYALHIPAGLSVVAAVGGALGTKEQWTVVSDMAPQSYQVVTHVTTDVGTSAVRTTVQALTLAGQIGLALDSAAGQAGQDLVMTFTL